MKIRLLVLTLLIIGVHQHIQAQYMLGTTGMMNIPTADRQKPGTVMLGGNYLPKQMMPARFDYNTGNYFVSISFFSFLELAYRETLIKGDYISSKPKYNQQDRSYSIRLCVWKEGKFLPGIALGANDPIADEYFSSINFLPFFPICSSCVSVHCRNSLRALVVASVPISVHHPQ
jgi:hypothetical protein